jgi:hypothetical protein
MSNIAVINTDNRWIPNRSLILSDELVGKGNVNKTSINKPTVNELINDNVKYNLSRMIKEIKII